MRLRRSLLIHRTRKFSSSGVSTPPARPARASRHVRLLGLLLLTLGATDLLAGPAGNVAAGRQAYATCVACHGANGEGNRALNAPRLAGKEGWYLNRQLMNYKQGIRGTGRGDVYGAQMKPMADTLRDAAAVANVVAYIGTLRAPPPTATVRGDVAKGRTLYQACAVCHGAAGQGVQAMNGPKLAGMNDWYLVTQLRLFRSGGRGANPRDTFGAQMAPMAKTLANDAAINDVVAYINSFAK